MSIIELSDDIINIILKYLSDGKSNKMFRVNKHYNSFTKYYEFKNYYYPNDNMFKYGKLSLLIRSQRDIEKALEYKHTTQKIHMQCNNRVYEIYLNEFYKLESVITTLKTECILPSSLINIRIENIDSNIDVSRYPNLRMINSFGVVRGKNNKIRDMDINYNKELKLSSDLVCLKIKKISQDVIDLVDCKKLEMLDIKNALSPVINIHYKLHTLNMFINEHTMSILEQTPNLESLELYEITINESEITLPRLKKLHKLTVNLISSKILISELMKIINLKINKGTVATKSTNKNIYLEGLEKLERIDFTGNDVVLKDLKCLKDINFSHSKNVHISKCYNTESIISHSDYASDSEYIILDVKKLAILKVGAGKTYVSGDNRITQENNIINIVNIDNLEHVDIRSQRNIDIINTNIESFFIHGSKNTIKVKNGNIGEISMSDHYNGRIECDCTCKINIGKSFDIKNITNIKILEECTVLRSRIENLGIIEKCQKLTELCLDDVVDLSTNECVKIPNIDTLEILELDIRNVTNKIQIPKFKNLRKLRMNISSSICVTTENNIIRDVYLDGLNNLESILYTTHQDKSYKFGGRSVIRMEKITLKNMSKLFDIMLPMEYNGEILYENLPLIDVFDMSYYTYLNNIVTLKNMNIKKIIMNSVYNSKITMNINTLEDITFGRDYNQKLKLESLPMRSIDLSRTSYNNNITIRDMDKLESIILPFSYSGKLDIYKNNKIKELSLGKKYSDKIDMENYSNLETLRIGKLEQIKNPRMINKLYLLREQTINMDDVWFVKNLIIKDVIIMK